MSVDNSQLGEENSRQDQPELAFLPAESEAEIAAHANDGVYGYVPPVHLMQPPAWVVPVVPVLELTDTEEFRRNANTLILLAMLRVLVRAVYDSL